MEQKKSSMKLIIAVSVIVAAVTIVTSTFLIIMTVGNLRASTMKLTEYTGNISLSDRDGKDIAVSAGKRLTDGNRLTTFESSKAWVLFDEDRSAAIMDNSVAVFSKAGKFLQLTLSEGSLFFNIEKALDDDESFEICTSTMVIGIRGTSGYVDTDEDGNEVIYMTSGKVTVDVTASGKTERRDVNAGQKLTVIVTEDGAEIIIEDFTEYDLPYDALLEIVGNEDLLEKVMADTGWVEDLRQLMNASSTLPGDSNLTGQAEPDTSEPDTAGPDDAYIPVINQYGYVEFGSYEQDAITGREPIEWVILSSDENGTLLVSRKVLSIQPYNVSGGETTWADCSYREWLNEDFFYAAFDASEQKLIKTVKIMTTDSANTMDRVFTLSMDELLQYYDYEERHDGYYSDDLWISTTIYASNLGANDFDHGTSMWWLRDTVGSKALFVSSEGDFGPNTSFRSDLETGGVRPAIYISTTF